MLITDEVQDVVYRNEDNGYCVLRLKNSGVATGVFAFVNVGQDLVMRGEWVNNARFGKQFKVTSYEVEQPNTPAKIKQFIGSGLIKGVGPATADRIVAMFGKDTLKVLDVEPHKLQRVRGISREKAGNIGQQYAQVKAMQDAVMFLSKFDISQNMAVKIYKKFGENTIERVQHNPYSLIEAITGIGFLTADKMAKDLGIAYDGPFRVRAGLIYVLRQESEQDGHTYLPRQELLMETCKLLRLKLESLEPVFEEVISEMCLDRVLTMVRKDGDVGYMLTKFYTDERAIAGKLCSLAVDAEMVGEDAKFEELLEHYERMNKITLHPMQREAVKTATRQGVCVITGGPGTGKTTIVKAILYINQAEGRVTKLLSPTGRAAKRLQDSTGQEASTIHRAIALDFTGGDRSFQMGDDGALEADVVIVDEVSMCDVVLTAHLLRRLLPRTRLVLVGDMDQLPSVGAGAVLGDIIRSRVIPVVRLTEIYRQEDSSAIVVNAHAINKGVMPDLTNRSSDFFYKETDSVMAMREAVVSMATTRIPKYLGIGSDKIQVLCPLKMGEVGMNNLNIVLQDALNPPAPEREEFEHSGIIYRVGDRVMQTVNNYKQEWTRQNPYNMGEGVFNGDIGIVTEVNRQNCEVTVELEDGRVTIYTKGELSNLVLAYAITVHKSQGSEFDVVIIPVTSGAYMILTRNLLYTAVTRAKRMVVLVGDAVNIEKMVTNTYTKKRHTMLADFLVEMRDKARLLYDPGITE